MVKIVKNLGNGLLNNLNAPVLNVLKIVSPDERASKAHSVQNTLQVFNNGKLIITVSWKQISWGIAMTLV
jgi:hypothetical protein